METKYTEIDIREKTYEYLIPLGFENKSRLHTDGYGKLRAINSGPYMLREAKRDIDFKDTNNVYKILLQCLKYLYDIAQEGEITPDILMIHDHSGYVILHTNPLIKYISNEDYNWTIRASEMSIQNNRKLFEDIKKDDLIILPLTKSFIEDGKTLKRQVEDILKGKKRRLPAVPKKLLQFFDPYEKYVILDKTLNQVEKVNLFINNILHPELVHPNDKLKNILHTLHGTTKIDRKEYDRLFQSLDLNWSEREKSKIVQFQDVLIEESRRRKKGEFFTPPLLVDAGWDLMYNAEGGKDRVLNDFGIWDNCAGTCNITKPLGNKPLNIWLSSLEYDDLVTAKTIGVNTNAKIFAHNFLNEDISVYGSEAEKSLYNYIQAGKKIICPINPPWARASNGHKGVGESRTNVAKTHVADEMKKEGKFGDASAQTYTQFFYKLDKLNDKNNITIGMYSTPSYLASQDFKSFREKILSKYEFVDGMIFDSKIFDGVSNFPGVYIIWRKSNKKIKHSEFRLKVFKPISAEEYEFDGYQMIYNLDSQDSLKKYCKIDEKKLTKIDYPGTTNGVVLKSKHKSRMYEESLGWLYVDSNCIEKNQTNIGLFSVGFSHGQGVPITKDNVIKCLGYFTYRALIKKGKYDGKNEYILPNNLEELEVLNYQSAVVSYFLTQNKCQNYNYDYGIINKLIPFNNFVFGRYSENCHTNSVLSSIILNQEHLLWEDTKELINGLKLIFNKLEQNNVNIEECDLSWKIVKKYIQNNFPDEFEIFNLKIKQLELQVKSKIYELGILKK